MFISLIIFTKTTRMISLGVIHSTHCAWVYVFEIKKKKPRNNASTVPPAFYYISGGPGFDSSFGFIKMYINSFDWLIGGTWSDRVVLLYLVNTSLSEEMGYHNDIKMIVSLFFVVTDSDLYWVQHFLFIILIKNRFWKGVLFFRA